MKFSNWKIGSKLALAFGFLALVTAAVGGLAVFELQTIEAARSEVQAETAAVGTLRQARFYLARQENAFRGYLLSGDPYYIERLTAHRENFVKNLTESAESKPSTDAIQAGYSSARTAADAWYALVEAEANRVRNGADRSVATAFVGRDGPSDAAIGPAEDAIDGLIDSKVEMRDISNAHLQSAVNKASLYLMIGAAFSALAAAVIGWLMTGAIARPLSRLAHVMDRLVANDVSVTVENVDRKDEIGVMSRALQVFKDNALGLIETSAQMGAAKRSQAVIEFSLDGTILDANQNFLDVMGYTMSEIKGRSHRLFVTPEFAASPAYDAMWQKLRSGEAIADKFHRIGKDGRKVIIDAFYTPIPGPDGQPSKVMKFASNVTESETARENDAMAQALVVGETGRGLAALVAGDLSFRIETAFPGEYAKLQTDFNAAMTALEEAMRVIGANASAMQSGAGEISQAADDLSRRTEQQAATLEETAAALDEITATVKRTAEGAERAGTVVAGAKSAAETSGLVVGRAVAAMGEIERSSDQISQIIGVIDEIAFQTNLLALNAGVEAARAGDAGRGFAVVASEVRALAQRSAEAAKEIKGLIAASSGHVKDGVGLVGETGEALTAIVERVAEINGLMAEITASAQEQATALSEVNTAVNQMDQTTQQNAAMVEQSTAASHNLSQEAEELAVLVGKFHVSGDGRGAARTGRAKPNPVRQAQARIADFARQPMPTPIPAPVRRVASGGAALAQSAEPQWEQF